MYLTLELLKTYTKNQKQLALFAAEYPAGVLLTKDVCQELAEVDLSFLLSKEKLAEYKAKRAPIYTEYKAKIATNYAVYANESVMLAYRAGISAIWAEYRQQRAALYVQINGTDEPVPRAYTARGAVLSAITEIAQPATVNDLLEGAFQLLPYQGNGKRDTRRSRVIAVYETLLAKGILVCRDGYVTLAKAQDINLPSV